jgi:hypothetical protein
MIAQSERRAGAVVCYTCKCRWTSNAGHVCKKCLDQEEETDRLFLRSQQQKFQAPEFPVHEGDRP